MIKEKQRRVEHELTKEEIAKKRKGEYVYYNNYDFINTGLLHFGIDVYRAKRKNWRDTENQKIEDQVGNIILWIMETINTEKIIREKRESEEIRRAEEERIRRIQQEKVDKEKQHLKSLEQHSTYFDKAEKIRRFIDRVELKLTDTVDQAEKQKITEWITWAREKADLIDPLVNKNDELLGKGFWVFDLFQSNSHQEDE